MSANLPLTWQDKKNSPELEAFLKQYGDEYYMTAEQINQMRDAVNEMAVVQQSNFLGTAEPTGTPTGTGRGYWEVIKSGTYTNFGGVVLGVNERGLIYRNEAGAFSISKVGFVIPAANNKIITWTATAFSSGEQVNYLGKDWVSNAETVAGDVPGASLKWVERLNGYADTAAVENKANLAPLAFYNKDFALFSDGFILGTGDFYNNTGYYNTTDIDTKPSIISYPIPIEPNTVIYTEGLFGYGCGAVEYDENMVKLPANWGNGASYYPYAGDPGQQKKHLKFTSQPTAKFLAMTLKFADVVGNFRTTAQVVKYDLLSPANKLIADSNVVGNTFQPIGTIRLEKFVSDAEIFENIARVVDVDAKFETTNANVSTNTEAIAALNGFHKNDAKNTILDGNTWGWYDANDLKSIIKDTDNKVSEWRDLSGNNRHLAQAIVVKRPLYNNGTILTDGIDDFMKVASPLSQPVTIYGIIEVQKNYSPNNEYIWDGGTANHMSLVRFNFTEIRMFKGAYVPSSMQPTSAMLVTSRYDGVNSILSINREADIVGDIGTFGSQPNGFTIGSSGDGSSSNVRFSEIIVRNKIDSAEERKTIEDYLIKKWRKEFDVWILAGQSNAVGFEGKLATTTDPAYKSIQENLIWNRVNTQWEKYNPEVNSADGNAVFGPENSFLKDLADKTGKKSRIIKVAFGNTPLAKNDIKVDWNVETVGEHYDTLKTNITNAVNWHKPLIAIPKLKGFIWMQGETDGADQSAWANAYFRNLINFTGGVLDHCNTINKANGVDLKMEVVIGKIRQVGTWSQTVRDAQVKYCAMRNANLIDTDEYIMVVDSPTVHYDSDSLILFGKDIVKSII